MWLDFLQLWWASPETKQDNSGSIPNGNEYLPGLNLSEKVEVIISWISYLHFHKGYNAQSIASHLSGIRSFFIEGGYENEFFLDLRVSKAKAGCLKMDAETGRSSLTKLPLPTVVFDSMLTAARSEHTLRGGSLAIGLILAMMCLLRCSEYTAASGNPHTIKGKNVEFWLETQQRYVASFLAHLLTETERSDISEVRITIPSSKTDRLGNGHQISFPRDSGSPQVRILHELLLWALMARSLVNDPFTSFRLGEGGKLITLTRSRVSNCIKASVLRFGLNPAFFSTHSLRITGATRLRAAGVSDQTIMRMGRWVSIASCCEYQRENLVERTMVTSILANSKELDVGDIRRMLN